MNAHSIFGRKLGRLLQGGYTPMQVLQRINRSPLKHVVKLAASATDPAGKARRRAYAKALPATPAVETLRARGHCAAAVDASLLRELFDATAQRRAGIGEEHRRANKGYLKAFIASELAAGRIDQDSIYVRFALQPSVVDVVAKYLHEAPYLSYVALDLSEYAGSQLQTSQLWHRDHDDTRVVKLFVYLPDVPDQAHGPFTLVSPRASRAIRGALSQHLPDTAVIGRVPPSEISIMTAAAGTAFMVDTGRCYHMGSRVAAGRERIMYTACYITWPAIYPDFRNRIAVTGDLGEREKLALLPTRNGPERETR